MSLLRYPKVLGRVEADSEMIKDDRFEHFCIKVSAKFGGWISLIIP